MSDAQVAGGGGRLVVYSSQIYRQIAPGAFPTYFSPPLTWARGTELVMTTEAYRGAIRVSGSLAADGRYPLSGPWTLPSGSFTLGGNVGAGPTAGSGTFSRYLTAA